MNSEREGDVAIDSESNIVHARRVVRTITSEVGFGVTDVTRIVTAASELTRNIFHYAGTGTMTWRILNSGGKVGVELIFEDHGPGISDIEQALQPGYSTRGGLGMGLPGAKRLMDEMEIRSEPGKGTRVIVRKWLRSL
jgi:serine/threonine-protein kinase RsbT